MAMLPGDYKRRIQTTNRGAAVNSGYAVLPVAVDPDEKPHEVCQAGGVVTLMSINATSTAGVNMWYQDSAGNTQQIVNGAINARDYKQNFYAPWPVYVSTDVNVTCYIAAPSKGNTVD
jgi:hypothetical protein